MLAANFQSFKVSFVRIINSTCRFARCHDVIGDHRFTLNLQSYMGIIMSVGVSIANAVLLITNAEQIRKHSGNALEAARRPPLYGCALSL